MKEKILVAGGTGFLGYHLLKKLLELKYDLYSISTKMPKKERKLKKIKYLICEVTKKNSIKKKLNITFDYIVNFSGYVDHSDKIKTMRSHYLGCKNLVDTFKNKKIKNFIQIGSSLEYGNSKSPHQETSHCRPRGNYGLAKLKASKYLQKVGSKNNLSFTVLRLYQIYGPNQSINRLIPVVVDSCLKNKIFSCSPGLQKRDFLFVGDLVKLILKIIKNKPSNSIFNVGSGQSIKVKNIINLIKQEVGLGKPIFGKINMRKDEAINNFPNINKVITFFNWRPSTKLKKGIKNTISFYEKK